MGNYSESRDSTVAPVVTLALTVHNPKRIMMSFPSDFFGRFDTFQTHSDISDLSDMS